MLHGAWSLATASSGITGFDAGKFTVDTSSFTNAPGSARFSLSSDGTNLSLTYSAVPEPAEWRAILGAVLLGMAFLRRVHFKKPRPSV